jgi:hypothetical protein
MQTKSRLAGTPNPGAILRHFTMYKALVVFVASAAKECIEYRCPLTGQPFFITLK